MIWILFFIIISPAIYFVYLGTQEWFGEKINCPVCGNRVTLVKGSNKCRRCRTRVIKTDDGRIIANETLL